MIVSVMCTPNDNLLELRVEGGVYKTRLYQYVESSEREIGVEEAKELQSIIRRTKYLDVESVIVTDIR